MVVAISDLRDRSNEIAKGMMNDREQQIIERYIQASYGLWNALLTINGLILAAGTMMPGTEVTCLKFIIVLLAIFSICLLTHNYVIIKLTYFRVGEVINSNANELTPEKKEQDINVAISRNKRVKRFEDTCLIILVLQTCLLAVGVGSSVAW